MRHLVTFGSMLTTTHITDTQALSVGQKQKTPNKWKLRLCLLKKWFLCPHSEPEMYSLSWSWKAEVWVRKQGVVSRATLSKGSRRGSWLLLASRSSWHSLASRSPTVRSASIFRAFSCLCLFPCVTVSPGCQLPLATPPVLIFKWLYWYTHHTIFPFKVDN